MIRKYITLLLVTLFATTALTGCLSEGDETIALESGQPKELIKHSNWRIKEWKGNPPSGLGWNIDDVFKFEDDGTLRKWPKDGKIHHWNWIIDPGNGGGLGGSKSPNGINIDNYDFGWRSWGHGHWVIYYPLTNPDNPSWVIDMGGDDDSDEHFEDEEPNIPEEPEVEEPTYIVKRITLTCNGEERERYDFHYDKELHITQLDMTLYGDERNKYTFLYEISKRAISVNYSSGYCIYEGALDENGRVCDDASYDNDGYLIEFNRNDGHSRLNIFEHKEDIWIYGADGYFTRFYCYLQHKYLNDSNIDLNCFIRGYFNEEHPHVLLAPFGYLGLRAPYLLESVKDENPDRTIYDFNNYKLDDKGLVYSIDRVSYPSTGPNPGKLTEVFTIEYWSTLKVETEKIVQPHYK